MNYRGWVLFFFVTSKHENVIGISYFSTPPKPSSRTEYEIPNEKMNLSNEHDLIGTAWEFEQFFIRKYECGYCRYEDTTKV